jgi:hypothetical protein
MILKAEWPAIQTAFRDTYDQSRQNRPRCLLITSLKRHATRFFPMDYQNRDGNGNPQCGTVMTSTFRATHASKALRGLPIMSSWSIKLVFLPKWFSERYVRAQNNDRKSRNTVGVKLTASIDV